MSTLRWVDQAGMRPYRCAVIPFVGNGSGQMFLDTGADLDLEHVYLSQQACELIAGMVGFVPADMLAERDARIAELEAQDAEQERVLELAREVVKGNWMVGKAREALREFEELEGAGV